jgi:hypothetical protein
MVQIGSAPDHYGERQTPTLNLAYMAKNFTGVAKAASDVEELRFFAREKLPRIMAFPHQKMLIKKWRMHAARDPRRASPDISYPN